LSEEMADSGFEDAGRGWAAGSIQPVRHTSALGFHYCEPHISAEVMREPNVMSSPTFLDVFQVVLTHVEGSAVPYLKLEGEEEEEDLKNIPYQ
jgi:hypothetical protein